MYDESERNFALSFLAALNSPSRKRRDRDVVVGNLFSRERRRPYALVKREVSRIRGNFAPVKYTAARRPEPPPANIARELFVGCKYYIWLPISRLALSLVAAVVPGACVHAWMCVSSRKSNSFGQNKIPLSLAVREKFDEKFFHQNFIARRNSTWFC